MKLEDSRKIPAELQHMFDTACANYKDELVAYKERRASGKFYHAIELNRLSMLYDNAAVWLEKLAVQCAEGIAFDKLVHTDRFFLNAIILTPAREHAALAEQFRAQIATGDVVCGDMLEQHYGRLAGFFNVTFSSFERKKYSNLSHEANKAMNLNSYISLIGKSWREVETISGLELHETTQQEADFIIADSKYINTIDADSLMLPDCMLRLVHAMEQPGNERLAVIQSPVSSVPGAQGLERAAGGCLDLQFFVHQGFSHWNASFWVGANAMLRRVALEDVRETRMEGGHKVSIYIQDRTVIEDTESSIDIVAKGWKLMNYPKRLSFSAMPGDFGSLLIQRRRWANGGLIILPKLFAYVWKAPKNLTLLKELFMRFHYLAGTTLACLVVPLLFLYPFGNNVSVGWWLSLSVLPGLVLYARLLRLTGYNYLDLMRIFALNLMLIPVHTGGVLKQFQQMITGAKIPFGRTPKVTGRTAAPALYCFVEVAITAGFLADGLMDAEHKHWIGASISLINGALMLYALIRFIGIKAIAEDISIGLKTRLREASHRAEIIPLPARWIENAVSQGRKSA